MHHSPQLGILIMMSAALCFGGGDIGIKVMGENLSPWQIAAGRGLLGVLAALTLIRFKVQALFIEQWRWQMLLGASGAVGFTCFIVSIKYLPLSIALPLAYVYPAVGALLSPLINKEKPGLADWLAIGMALAAVLCLARGAPGQGGENVAAGLAFGLVGVLCGGLMINLARRQNRAPVGVNLFYLYLGNLALGLAATLAFDGPALPAGPDLARLFFFISPMYIIGFALMFLGYRHINAHRGGIVLTLEAAAAAIYGLAILNEPATWPVVLGGLLIFSSGLTIIRAGSA